MCTVLLITPPFTQLNTPYPATAYLKGFLNTKQVSSYQIDLGLEVILKLFSKQGLEQVFANTNTNMLNENTKHIYTLQSNYINTIDEVIAFLQGQNTTLAYTIVAGNYLPQASRFATVQDYEYAFGNMGIQDKAKYMATLYLEDIGDYIQQHIDKHFGFSRYADKLARCANTFDELFTELLATPTYIDEITFSILKKHIEKNKPKLIAFTAPFPGNVYSAFACGKFIKQFAPNIKIAFGGGFANTELRHLADDRVFQFVDFITLDDGEQPLEQLLNFINNTTSINELKRTFLAQYNGVQFYNNANCADYKQAEVGTPDYTDLLLDKYIAVVEVLNPMHSLWSNGRWNKLTMAHGCYWGKCTFCDTSLPYIGNYEPIAASLLVDRMVAIIKQTGTNGFHFVDEAAPPALMAALAAEIIKRKLTVSWWTNVRFEKNFTQHLCLLLRESGCIGVSGGLEVASDRLLKLIDKGISIEQVSHVNKHFIQAGIMVHAYLMYGYPTQTVQETIDSLEVVRQMFEQGVLQSAFWHQFALTVHSPISKEPNKYGIHIPAINKGTFANNDLEYTDSNKVNHEQFSFGLTKSLFNYMQNVGLDKPLQTWFDNKIPNTTIDKNLIKNYLNNPPYTTFKPNAKIYFTGKVLSTETVEQRKHGNSRQMLKINFIHKINTLSVLVEAEVGQCLLQIISHIQEHNYISIQQAKDVFNKVDNTDFDMLWYNKPFNTLYKIGLLVV
jgi:radical SAM superfamily enzyme YgiQ (UPF0313 family)